MLLVVMRLPESEPDRLEQAPATLGSIWGEEKAEIITALGKPEPCAVKPEKVPESTAAGSSTAASRGESVAGDSEVGGCSTISADAALPLKLDVVPGSASVPSKEALHSELRTFELLTQLRAVARRWALHQDNFFFHWNRLCSEWKAREKKADTKSNSAQVMEAKVPVHTDSLHAQQRSETSNDSVDILWYAL